MDTIGQRIRKLREAKGITQEEMAGHLGVTQSNYGRLEKKDDRLNIVKLMEISRVLKVSIPDLLPGMKVGGPERIIYDELVQNLKQEIAFLRRLVKR